MEFSSGFQTASNSEIKCQGTDILIDRSIQKGIVTHMECIIQIETEVFSVEGSRDKGDVLFRASSMQSERSITGLCGSFTYLCMEPTCRQLYLQEN